MITIKEIAALAGTSRGTVDRALKGRPGVNRETKERIERICREHHYIPNRAGVLLGMSGKQFRIGAILPSLDNDFFGGIISGLERAEEEYSDFGVRVELFELGGTEAEQLAAIDLLESGGMQALVIWPAPGAATERRLRLLAERGIGVVTLGPESCPGRASISCGWQRCGRAAGEFCAMLPYPGENLHVGIVSGSNLFPGGEELLEGFLEIVRSFPHVSVRRIVECERDTGATAEKIRRMLKNYPEIRCLFVMSEAVPALEAAAVPSGIAVISIGETEAASNALRLGRLHAIVSEQSERQGELAIRLIVDSCINGREIEDSYEIPSMIRNKYCY